MAALGEMWQGGGKGFSDIVMVTLGTGVGGGVILDKKIVAGKHGTGGEIGHLRIREGEKEPCNCGGYGCLEQVASATGIAREARRAMEQDSSDTEMRKFGADITAKDVLGLREGRRRHGLPRDGYRILLPGLGSVRCVHDRRSGGVCHRRRRVQGRQLSDRGNQEIFRPVYHLSDQKAEITLAQLGNDAGIYGAARLILD